MGRSLSCPACGGAFSDVVDSRPKQNRIRRRRKCTACGFRFSTIEVYGQSVMELRILEKIYVLMQELAEVRGDDTRG